jgi:hypothetical protein
MLSHSHDFSLLNDRGVRLYFQGPEKTEPSIFEYHLYDHSVSAKWFSRAQITQQKGNFIPQHGGDFFGKPFYPKENLVADFERIFNVINSEGEDYIEGQIGLDMTQSELNRLHRDFERLAKKTYYQSPSVDPQIFQEILNLNLTIHRYEGHLGGAEGCHIEVNFQPVEYCELEDEEYHLFTPDRRNGNMYLTYGQVGVPTIAAFFSGVNDSFLPQSKVSAGFFLLFDQDFDFDQWDQLRSWLEKTHHLNASDPRLAIGFIPLGRLVNRSIDSEANLQELSEHLRISKVELIGV